MIPDDINNNEPNDLSIEQLNELYKDIIEIPQNELIGSVVIRCKDILNSDRSY